MTQKQDAESKTLTENWLGETLKHARQRAGFSASRLSQLSGHSTSYVTKIEHGDINPSTEAFAVLVLLLHLTDDEIVWTIKALGSRALNEI